MFDCGRGVVCISRQNGDSAVRVCDDCGEGDGESIFESCSCDDDDVVTIG